MVSPAEQIEDLVATAHALCDVAGAAILPFFRRSDLDADSKVSGAFDPVTEADRAAEQAMRSVLCDRRPADGIVGEEFGATSGTSGLTWILDPIDGTRGFLSGTPTWGVLVAVARGEQVLVGIVDQPYTGERFVGAAGTAELIGPRGRLPLATRAPRPLDQAILFTTFPEIGSGPERAAFEAVSRSVRLTRYGMDCYAYALLAAGQIDLVVEAGLQSYDVAAPIGLIEAAGGFVTDWTGRPVLAGGRVLAAANRDIHRAALALLASPAAAD